MNWINHNLSKRSHGVYCDFKVSLIPTHVEYVSFLDACAVRAEQIYRDNRRIYIGFSGGIDSEFVLNVFLRAGIPVVPVIISTPFNTLEVQRAKKYCGINNIELRVIEISCSLLVKKLYYKTLDVGLYTLIGGVPSLVHDYFGGVVVTGNQDPFDPVDPSKLEFCEYGHYEFGGAVVNFFDDLPVIYSMIKEIDVSLHTSAAKAKLYNLPERSKVRYDTRLHIIDSRLRPAEFKYKYEIKREEFLRVYTS